MSWISYAPNYEDVLLERCFKDVDDGFYIDVGAWDPVKSSITKHFYEKGWSGINIEPCEEYFLRLCKDRPRDLNLRVALGAEAGEAVFHEFTESQVSTLSDATREHLKRFNVVPLRDDPIRVSTLADVCRSFVNRTIHFLKIDVEGFEKEVIEGADWKRFRPIVLLVEATLPSTTIPDWAKWEPRILAEGYAFAYYDGLNRYYVREDYLHLRSCFDVPVNWSDMFVPAALRDLQQEIDQLKEQSREAAPAASANNGTNGNKMIAADTNMGTEVKISPYERAGVVPNEADKDAVVAMLSEVMRGEWSMLFTRLDLRQDQIQNSLFNLDQHVALTQELIAGQIAALRQEFHGLTGRRESWARSAIQQGIQHGRAELTVAREAYQQPDSASADLLRDEIAALQRNLTDKADRQSAALRAAIEESRNDTHALLRKMLTQNPVSDEHQRLRAEFDQLQAKYARADASGRQEPDLHAESELRQSLTIAIRELSTRCEAAEAALVEERRASKDAAARAVDATKAELEKALARIEVLRRQHEKIIGDLSERLNARIELAHESTMTAETMTTRAEVLGREFAGAQRRLSELEGSLADGHRRTKELEEERADSQRRLAELESRLAASEPRTRELEAALAASQQLTQELEESRVESQRRLTESAETLSASQSRATELEGNLAGSLQRGKELEQALADSQQGAQEREASFAVSQRRTSEGEEILADSQQRLKDLEAALGASRQRTRELEDILQDSHRLAQERENVFTGLQRRAHELEESLTGSQRQVRELEETLADSQRRAHEVEKTLAGSQQRTGELEAIVGESHKRTKELSEALGDSQWRAKELEESLRDAQRRTGESEDALAGSQRRTKELEAVVGESQKRARELELTLAGSQQRTRELEQSLAGSERRLKELGEKLSGVLLRADDGDRRIEALLDSPSWRMTAPLRAVLGRRFRN